MHRLFVDAIGSNHRSNVAIDDLCGEAVERNREVRRHVDGYGVGRIRLHRQRRGQRLLLPTGCGAARERN